MIGSIILLIICIVILGVLWYFLKNITQLILNAIIGIILLFLMNFVGLTNITIGWLSILICAVGGVPGAILLAIFNLLGLL